MAQWLNGKNLTMTLSRRELARLITRIENGEPGAQATLNELYARTGRARVIGVTGAPGTGKSTLVAEMGRALRAQPATPQVAIVAVDPSSPFSGGAILGDRIRMRDLFGDPGVFIRSMASRGALGGIASATADVVSVLDACDFDYVVIETVGAGQLEVDVARIAQTVIVVEAPGNGDEVQAVKAGILEIADIIVVNKADREGVAQTVSALQSALDVSSASTGHHGLHGREGQANSLPYDAWQTPIVKTSAMNREGIQDLLDAMDRHGQFLRESGAGEQRRLRHVEADIQFRLRELLLRRALQQLPVEDYRRLVAAAARRDIHPGEAVALLLKALGR
jgi:LAO/AO transport system kinase